MLLNGEGAGQAKYAEVNGFPGPKHVLELADSLVLSVDQRKSVKLIHEEMLGRALEVGKSIVKIEEEFNGAFKDGLITAHSVNRDAEEIGRLRGKLRAIHLNAHLKTKALLSAKQITTYMRLRNAPSHTPTGHEGHKH